MLRLEYSGVPLFSKGTIYANFGLDFSARSHNRQLITPPGTRVVSVGSQEVLNLECVEMPFRIHQVLTPVTAIR